MSARDKRELAEALRRIEILEHDGRELLRRIQNLENLLPGRLTPPPPPPRRV